MIKITIPQRIQDILDFWPLLAFLFGVTVTLMIAFTPSAIMSHALIFRPGNSLEIGFFYALWLTGSVILYFAAIKGMFLDSKNSKKYLFWSIVPSVSIVWSLFIPVISITFINMLTYPLILWGISGFFFVVSRFIDVWFEDTEVSEEDIMELA